MAPGSRSVPSTFQCIRCRIFLNTHPGKEDDLEQWWSTNATRLLQDCHMQMDSEKSLIDLLGYYDFVLELHGESMDDIGLFVGRLRYDTRNLLVNSVTVIERGYHQTMREAAERRRQEHAPGRRIRILLLTRPMSNEDCRTFEQALDSLGGSLRQQWGELSAIVPVFGEYDYIVEVAPPGLEQMVVIVDLLRDQIGQYLRQTVTLIERNPPAMRQATGPTAPTT